MAKKGTRKILSVIVAVMLVCGLLPTPLAFGEGEVASVPLAEAGGDDYVQTQKEESTEVVAQDGDSITVEPSDEQEIAIDRESAGEEQASDGEDADESQDGEGPDVGRTSKDSDNDNAALSERVRPERTKTDESSDESESNATSMSDADAAFAPLANDVLTIDTDLDQIQTVGLDTLLAGLYTSQEIEAATTLKIIGSQSNMRMGTANVIPSSSITYLNSLSIDTIDISDFTGTFSVYTFAQAINISTVIAGSGMTEMPAGMFHKCSSLTTLADSATNAVVNAAIIDLDGIGLTEFDGDGFQFAYCASITSVTLGGGIEYLPPSLFHACYTLSTLNMTVADVRSYPGIVDLANTNVEAFDVGGSQFGGCETMTTVTLGTSISTLPRYVFQASGLSTLSNTRANAQANPGVIDLEKTEVIDLDTEGDQFSYIEELTTVTLGSALSDLPGRVFYGSFLTTISDTVENARLYPGVIDLEKTGVRSLRPEGNQFAYCPLTTVTLGDEITTLPTYVFDSCEKLTTISDTVENTQANPGVIDLAITYAVLLESGGGQFSNCSSVVTVVLGQDIDTLPGYVFYSCDSLVTISDTIANAVANPGVIDLEKTGVTALDGMAHFMSSSALTTVTLKNTIDPLPMYFMFWCDSLETFSDTLAHARGESKGLLDYSKFPGMSFDSGGAQFGEDEATIAYAGVNGIALPFRINADGSIFVPETVTSISLEDMIYEDVFYLRGPQASSPTLVTNGGNMSNPRYYLDVEARAVGSGTIAPYKGDDSDNPKGGNGFLPDRIENRERLNGALAATHNYVEAGETLAYTITPNQGYALKSVTVNGIAVTPTPVSGVAHRYTLAGVDEDSEIIATFALEHTITERFVDRDGKAIPGLTTQTKKIVDGGAYAGVAPTKQGYIFVGFETVAPTPSNRSTIDDKVVPTIANVTSNATFYYVYGTDSGDGFEDVSVVRQWVTIRNGSYAPIPATTTDTRAVNIGDAVTLGASAAPAPSASALSEYVYQGYLTDKNAIDDPAQGGSPTITASIVDGNRHVYYVYKQKTYSVTYQAVDQQGTNLLGVNTPATETGKTKGSVFGPVIPGAPPLGNYAYVGWRTSTSGSLNTTPVTGTVSGNMTVYLVYSNVDVQVSRHFKGMDDTSLTGKLRPQTIVMGLNDSPYTVAQTGVVEQGWNYVGWNTTGSTTSYQPGNPNIALQAGKNVNVYYLYARNANQVTIQHKDESGNEVSASVSRTVSYGSSFSYVPPSVTGYDYLSWSLDGAVKDGGTPSLARVVTDVTVTCTYRAQGGPGPGPGPGPNPENYEFVKKPNVKVVHPGERVTYTFAGFGNKWGIPLEHYSIADKPDKGLDITGASLPAFTNGQGVTYDIVYMTNLKGKTVLYSNISATRPFSFQAPSLSAGEYITGITFEFGTVPAGFAMNDTFQVHFRVWDNPPARVLKNQGVLSYKVGDDYKQFFTGDDTGSLTLGGWFGLAKMGDGLVAALPLAVVSIVLLGVSLRFIRRRRKKGVK